MIYFILFFSTIIDIARHILQFISVLVLNMPSSGFSMVHMSMSQPLTAVVLVSVLRFV